MDGGRLAGWVHSELLAVTKPSAGNPIRRRALGAARNFLVKVQGDPSVTAEAGGIVIALPLSHQYPYFRRLHPGYSNNLTTVARLVDEVRPHGSAIDIGANVGDSTALIKSGAPGMPVLCIEGDWRYVPYLKRNTAVWRDVHIEAPVLLGKQTGEVAGKVVSRQGTSYIDLTEDGTVLLSSLDELLNSRQDFVLPALLKSDTDGFEDRILRGAEATLRRSHPVLFIEYDPFMLTRAGANGLSLLAWLEHLGYRHAAFYDHLGNLLVRCSLNDHHLLGDLDRYVGERIGPVPYYDIVLSAPRDRAVIDHLPDQSIQA